MRWILPERWKTYDFFVPDRDYCTNLGGLLEHLWVKRRPRRRWAKRPFWGFLKVGVPYMLAFGFPYINGNLKRGSTSNANFKRGQKPF